jgi:O-antigen/teichoic acid export membrane protein
LTTSTRPRTTRHFTALFLGEGIAQVLSFAAATVLARVLEPSGYGMWTYAFTIVMYAVTLVEAGSDTWGIREISANRARLADVVGTVMSLRAVLAAIAIALLVAYAGLAEPPGLRRWAILCGIGSIIAIMLQTHWALRAIDVIPPVAIAGPLQRGIFFAAIVIAVHDSTATPWVVLWQGVSEIIVSVYLLIALRRTAARPIHAAAWPAIAAAGRSTWPVGAARALRGIMYTLNVAVLARMWPNETVGQYGVATRLLMALLAISTLFGTAVAPGLARAAAESAGAAARALRASMRGASVMFLPIAVGGALVAPRLVSTLFGPRYAPAALPLRILLGTLVVAALVDVLRRGLHFMHRQHDDLRNMIACAVASVALTAALVPSFGTLGASTALALADLTLLALSVRSVGRAGMPLQLAPALAKPVLATLAMAAVLFPIRAWPLAITVPLGGAVFAAALVILRDTTLSGLKVLDAPETMAVREIDSAVASESPADHLP